MSTPQAYNNMLEMTAGQRSKEIDIVQAFKRAELDEQVDYDEIRAALKR